MMTVRALDSYDVEEDIPFEDADQVGAEFYDYVVQAYNNEIITGLRYVHETVSEKERKAQEP